MRSAVCTEVRLQLLIWLCWTNRSLAPLPPLNKGIKSAGTWLDDKIKRNFLLYWFGNEGPAASLVIPDHLGDGAVGQVGGKAAVWIPAAMKGNLLSRKCDWALFNCRSLVGQRVG